MITFYLYEQLAPIRFILRVLLQAVRKFTLTFLFSLFTLTIGSLPVYASDTSKWSSRFSVELKADSDHQIGILDLLAPLWQHTDRLLFADVRLVDTSGTGIEGNLGLGYRKLEQDSSYFGGEWIWGLYGFYDRRHTASNNNFSQVTIGAELYTDSWLFRGNMYKPESSGKTVDTLSGSNEVGLSGTEVILQQTNSLVAKEYALPGIDVEVGRRFDLSNNDEFWLYAGYFNFNRSEAPKIAGPRLRAEYRQYDVLDVAGSEFSIGAEFQDDDIRGSKEFLFLRLRFPFGERGSKKLHHLASKLEQRMTEYVVRDNDIVSFAQDINKPVGSVGGPEIVAGSGTGGTTPIVDPISGESLNVFIVDNAGGGDCTQASPCTLAVAQANANYGAGDVIIVTNSAGVVVGNVDLTTGALGTARRQVVGGASAVSLALSSGDTLSITGLGGRPTLNGTVTLADDASIRNFDIASPGNAIVANGITNASVDDVNINSAAAAGINLQNISGNVAVSNSSIQNTTGTGILLNNISGSFSIANASISNATGSGIQVGTNTGTVAFTGTTTVGSSGSTAIDLTASTGTINFGDVDITNLGGVTGVSTAGSSGVITMASLDITGTGAANSTGVDITGSTGSLTVTNAGTIQNVITAFDLDSLGTGSTNSTLSYQTGTINAGVPVNTIGINAGNYDFTGTTINKNNTLSTATGFSGDFWYVDATGGGNGTSTDRASANFVETNSSAGDIIVLVDDRTGNIAATNGLQLKNNQQLIGFAAGLATVDFTGSNAYVLGNFQYQINDPTGNGAATLTNAGGTEVVTLADNIRLRDFNLTTTGAVDGIAGNSFTGATINSIAISNAGAEAFDFTNATGTIIVTDSSASNSTGAGLRVNGGNASIALNNFDVTDTGSGRSVVILATTGGSITFDSNSSVTNSGGSGVLIDNIGGDITFNAAVNVTSATSNAVTATNLNANSVSFNGGVGITTASGNGLTASGGNLNIAGTGNSINAINGGAINFSNLTVSNGGGGALTFSNLNSSGGANGIALTNVTASDGLTVNSATLANNTTAGLNINGVTGSLNITAANVDAAAAGTAVAIAGSNGTLNIGTSGAGLDIDGGTTGVSINQTAGTVNLGTGASGVFAVDGTSGTGINLAGGGTVNIGTGGGSASIGVTTTTTGTAIAATGGNATFNYAGDITNTSGYLLDVQSTIIGSSVTITGGSITDSGSGIRVENSAGDVTATNVGVVTQTLINNTGTVIITP